MQTTNAYKCSPVTGFTGAVIEGIDATRPLPSEAVAFVEKTIAEWGVVFFPNQEVSDEQLGAFASHFSPLMHEPFSPETVRDTEKSKIGQADMSRTKNATAVWHHDTTFVAEPPYFTFLRAVRIPPYGGDTCWASMYAAYEALSPNIQRMLEGLTAVHNPGPTIARMGEMAKKYFQASTAFHSSEYAHPVVIAHPVTGRKALFVNEGWTTHIVELSAAESRYVLSMLFDHVKSPTFMVRWRWTPNDLAMWDNRAVQHFAVPDYAAERIMQRTLTSGARPTAPKQ